MKLFAYLATLAAGIMIGAALTIFAPELVSHHRGGSGNLDTKDKWIFRLNSA